MASNSAPKPSKHLSKFLITECCGQRLIWHGETLGDDVHAWCPECKRPLYIVINGKVYLLGKPIL
ncbi:hypothetical protein [Paenibacillus naphthalenovorans]|uniref:hypothetical protein n=1 Tax=Paenibacillus naphthalenovorans TaxID=162209 RepID=UPI000891765D|nr:hypothetical protein [Paenibacillus naphthalenovorans]SDJ76782.1 hypothetical protein SAMN05421868_14334 [Paenibacillus naphthalenovorans]